MKAELSRGFREDIYFIVMSGRCAEFPRAHSTLDATCCSRCGLGVQRRDWWHVRCLSWIMDARAYSTDTCSCLICRCSPVQFVSSVSFYYVIAAPRRSFSIVTKTGYFIPLRRMRDLSHTTKRGGAGVRTRERIDGNVYQSFFKYSVVSTTTK